MSAVPAAVVEENIANVHFIDNTVDIENLPEPDPMADHHTVNSLNEPEEPDVVLEEGEYY